MRFRSVSEWLDWQQGLHPKAIDMGLERVRAVAARLGVLHPECPVFTVAGTNGKGSCVAYLESILGAAGLRVGAYTSPHLLRYNERIRIGGHEASDAELVEAFERVDQARGGESLTYFEFGTLSALDLFQRRGCQAWVLEVGLGGRLDAVNIVDPDVAIVTSVGLDHTDWLGPDRETIGAEKAGIFRPGRPAIYAEADVPASVLRRGEEIGTSLRLAGRDYRWQAEGERWSFSGPEGELRDLPRPRMIGGYQLGNAAAALAALQSLGPRLPIDRTAVERGLLAARVAGRFQVVPGSVEWILDVAHNRDSAACLSQALAERPVAGRTLAVFAQMQRKELEPVLEALLPAVDRWWLLELPDADARPAEELATALRRLGAEIAGRAGAPGVFDAVAAEARPGDRVIVFGSFRTVEEALRYRGLKGAEVLEQV